MLPGLLEMGLAGVEIGTNICGLSLDDRRFDDFFAGCEELGAIVFVHPCDAMASDRLAHHDLSVSLGNLVETAEAASSLVLGGVLDRHPRLRIVLAHGGGAFIAALPRIDQCWASLPSASGACTGQPSSYAKRFTYDTLVYGEGLLRHLVDNVGTGSLVIGSDYPFALAERPPGATFAALDLPPADVAAVARGNASELLSRNETR